MLTDLAVKVNMDEGETCSGEFCLETLTIDGRTDKEYYWYADKKHGGSKGGVVGWYDDAGDEQYIGDTDVEFEAGQGFWTQGGGFQLTSAGQVLMETVKVTTSESGKVLIGNPYPVDINLVDMYVEVDLDEGESCSGEFCLETLTIDGRTDKEYYWYADKKHGGSKGGVVGWYDDAGDVMFTREDNVILKAGGAYWTQGGGFTLVFPTISL